MEGLGENYEYIKTIISNKLEIAKLDAIEMVGNIVGFLFVGFMLICLSVLVLFGLLTMLIIWLNMLTNSLIVSISIACLSALLLGVIVYVNRKKLIVNPILNGIGEILMKQD